MPAQPPKRGRAMLGIALTVLGLVAGFVLGGFAVYRYGNLNAPHETTAAADRVRELDKVTALGRIQPRDGILSLGVPAPDRIRRIKVKEGDAVKQGEILAVLDGQVLRELERDLAVIQRDQAEKRLKAVTTSGEAQVRVEEIRRDQIEQLEPLEIDAQASKIKFLQSRRTNAQKDYERYLAAGDTVADQDKEKQRLLLDQIETELSEAKSQQRKARESRQLDRKLATSQLEAARAELERARSAISLEVLGKQIDQAAERLKETELRAPTPGTILRLLVHEGELVHGQAILQMANTDNMIVVAEVYETDIQRVEVGQKATITSHIFKGQDALMGKVVSKGMSVGRGREVDLDPRAAVDRRVVDVKIALDQSKQAATLIGHQVHVKIATAYTSDDTDSPTP
ncbi:MAG TPA: efflux RND transporter periplasmic adaptor subunit [Gemmataceae bacterium]|jgi:HlyD family secretion protein